MIGVKETFSKLLEKDIRFLSQTLTLQCLVFAKRSHILKKKPTGLFKYVRPFSGHQALKDYARFKPQCVFV